MLEQIISETKTMEADAVKAETDAQKAYEAFVKDTNASVEDKIRAITNKSEEKATAEQDKVATEEELTSALNELQELMNENADLHKSCDFTLDGGGVDLCSERAAGAHERERGPPQELRLHARQLRRPPGGARPGDGRLARGEVGHEGLQLRLLAEVNGLT